MGGVFHISSILNNSKNELNTVLRNKTVFVFSIYLILGEKLCLFKMSVLKLSDIIILFCVLHILHTVFNYIVLLLFFVSSWNPLQNLNSRGSLLLTLMRHRKLPSPCDERDPPNHFSINVTLEEAFFRCDTTLKTTVWRSRDYHQLVLTPPLLQQR